MPLEGACGAEGLQRADPNRPHLDYARPMNRASGASIRPARRRHAMFDVGYFPPNTPPPE